MSDRKHWREDPDYLTGGQGRWVDSPLVGMLGETDQGFLLLPTWRLRRNWWDRRLRPWRPTHWLPYLRSRITRRVVFLEEGAQ